VLCSNIFIYNVLEIVNRKRYPCYQLLLLVNFGCVVVVVTQSSEKRLAGRLSTVSLLRDLLSQFSKLSDEADVSEAEHEVSRTTEQLNELNELLSARRAAVEVRQTWLSLFIQRVSHVWRRLAKVPRR